MPTRVVGKKREKAPFKERGGNLYHSPLEERTPEKGWKIERVKAHERKWGPRCKN